MNSSFSKNEPASLPQHVLTRLLTVRNLRASSRLLYLLSALLFASQAAVEAWTLQEGGYVFQVPDLWFP